MENKVSVFSILRRRYPESEYALMAEVSDKAGHHRSRSADFVVMNLWPSRGLSLSGIEVKSSRSDWLSELKRPQKAENIFQYCDFFWLLTKDESVAKIEEIPETWGWMYLKGSRIFVKKEAPKLTPVPISRHFLASLLKRASTKDGYILKDDIQDHIDVCVERERTRLERELLEDRDELIKLKNATIPFST